MDLECLHKFTFFVQSTEHINTLRVTVLIVFCFTKPRYHKTKRNNWTLTYRQDRRFSQVRMRYGFLYIATGSHWEPLGATWILSPETSLNGVGMPLLSDTFECRTGSLNMPSYLNPRFVYTCKPIISMPIRHPRTLCPIL